MPAAARRLRPRFRAPAHLALASGAALGCSGDHDFLAQRSVDAAVPMDGPAAADVRGEVRRVDVTAVDTQEASIDGRIDVSEPPEPPGRWTFTWMNGLIDADGARFCFVPVLGDREMRDQVVPVPAEGLPFGKSLVFGELRGIDPSTMGVHPYAVVKSGADAGGGAGCAAILDAQDGAVAEDGAVRGPIAISLPLIPAGTLAEGRSYLGVATGCALRWPFADIEAGVDAADARNDTAEDADATGPTEGGTSRDASGAEEGGTARDASDDRDTTDAGDATVFTPPARVAVCGASSGAPNAGLVLVRLSRRSVGSRIGLQAVHASTAVAGARIAVERTGGTTPVFSADVGPYQIAPRDGLTAVTIDAFGPSIGAATLRIASPVSAFPAVSISLASALAESGIDETALLSGDLLSLVLIGAQPGQNPGPPWNNARITIVRNAPLEGGD